MRPVSQRGGSLAGRTLAHQAAELQRPVKTLVIAGLMAVAALLLPSCGPAGGGPGPASPTAGPEGTAPASEGPVVDAPAACPSGEASRDSTILYGGDAGDYLADRFSLASGDFNGDGFGDVLVGAPLADGPENGRENVGEAYVVLGSSSPPASVDVGRGPDVTLFGEAAGDNFGFTVAAGDINGDGIDDVLVGARFAASGLGKTYVILGRADLQGSFDAAQGQQDVTVIGRESGDFLGIALGSGDVNGDSIDDLLIGASGGSGPDGERELAGEAYVILGSRSLAATIDLGQGDADFTVFGAAARDFLPNYVSSGDVDGDGKEELLLGVPFAETGDPGRNDAGEAYIVRIPKEGGSLDLATAAEGFTRLTGADPADGLGFYLAAGDLNKDGKADVLIGARNGDGPDNARSSAGEVYVLPGSADLPASLDLREGAPGLIVHGAEPGDSLGFTVASGDVNGDGYEDLVAGAPIGKGCLSAGAEAGQVYVIFGSDALSEPIDLAVQGADIFLPGAEGGDEFGFSLATADLDGDGKDDIVAGALLGDGLDNSREDAGEAVITLSR